VAKLWRDAREHERVLLACVPMPIALLVWVMGYKVRLRVRVRVGVMGRGGQGQIEKKTMLSRIKVLVNNCTCSVNGKSCRCP